MGPYIAALVLFAGSTAIGIAPVRKLIVVREAKNELRHGSAGFLRSLAGWSWIIFWLATTWFLATIIGDWGATDDLNGAIARAALRLRILLEILAAVADSDA